MVRVRCSTCRGARVNQLLLAQSPAHLVCAATPYQDRLCVLLCLVCGDDRPGCAIQLFSRAPCCFGLRLQGCAFFRRVPTPSRSFFGPSARPQINGSFTLAATLACRHAQCHSFWCHGRRMRLHCQHEEGTFDAWVSFLMGGCGVHAAL